MNRRTFLKLAIYANAVTLAGSYPILIERTVVRVNRYRIPIIDLPPVFQGFTLAHLTDLHLGFLVSETFVEEIVRRTNGLGADVIVCTGDYVHAKNTIEEIEKIWPIMSKLAAKKGVFSVVTRTVGKS